MGLDVIDDTISVDESDSEVELSESEESDAEAESSESEELDEEDVSASQKSEVEVESG